MSRASLGNGGIVAGLIAVGLCLAGSGVSAATYKCKDGSGRVSYSELPCANPASQTRIKTDADGRDEFIRRLHELAAQPALWDAAGIEKTFGVKLVEVTADANKATYAFASPPFDGAARSGVFVAGEGSTLAVVGLVEVRLDSKRCLSLDTLREVFGIGGDGMLSDTALSYMVKAGAYTSRLSAHMSDRDKRCIEYLSLEQVPPRDPSPPDPSPSRRRRVR